MYSLRAFAEMIGDRVRMDAYTDALKRVITPDSVVVDIGTGTGIFALIACQLGARKVYAIETNPLVELGKKMAAANGFADRIEFIQDYSTRIDLPELADVIMGDLRGRLPFQFPNIATFYDARERFLKPNGVILPKKDFLYAGVIGNAHDYNRFVAQPWADNIYQLDMTAAMPISVNSPVDQLPVKADQVLLPGRLWESIEYGIRSDSTGNGSVTWRVHRGGRAHFIALWFDTEIMDGICYSGNPLNERRPKVYGSWFFPLQEPLDLVPGQLLTLDIDAHLVGQEYIYRWQTSLFANQDACLNEKPLKRFSQSTFFGNMTRTTKNRTLHAKPRLNRSGKVQSFILDQMRDGDATLEDIVRAVQTEFPRLAQSSEALFEQVANLAERFGE